MTIYRVNWATGDDANSGTNWTTDVIKTLTRALVLATTDGDVVYLHKTHAEENTVDTTYMLGAHIRILCVDKDNSDALSTGAVLGGQTANYSLLVSGAMRTYWYGVTFKNGTNTSGAKNIIIGSSLDGWHSELESCEFSLAGTAASRLNLGAESSVSTNSYTKLINCTFRLASTSHLVQAKGPVEFVGGSLANTGDWAGTFLGAGTMVRTVVEGMDLSLVSGTLVADATNGPQHVTFINCKLHASVTIRNGTNSVANKGGVTVWAFNCSAGDNHYAFYHGDAFGSTLATTSVYANDSAEYDGTNGVGWAITTTANCSFFTPYVSPWIDVYVSSTSAISPYLEALRKASTTKYTNSEVWAEVSYQGTSSSTKASFANDRCAVAADPTAVDADQTASSLDASGWTGEDATNNAFMKLGIDSNSSPTTITPAEIGHLRMRVVVGKASVSDLYIDPKIRGLS